ncbi:MAG: 23S rRNA (guanosine(2251)-2'-O)-methyltransferase RlmB [Actinomycetota bacterium]|nr:MAG: 23S rRNA (guanosine(2251)-2'-O)-methyltransferase RlmB [Actinomycetota bacterium]
MAGNSQRKGAMRKAGTKKGQVVGSGGQRRRGLEPKGPTPKATEREKHPAARRARAADQRAGSGSGRPARAPGSATAPARPAKDGPELVVGRNAVVEALRAQVPATTLYVQQYVDTDDRIRESLAAAADRGIALLEVGRSELDRIAGRAVHQGLALRVPPYSYADLDDLLAGAGSARQEPLLVALDAVTDPRNLGAVIRSAAAFGAHGVVVPARRAAGVSAAAWKTSAGAAARVPVARVVNLTRALVSLQRSGFTVVGLAAGGASSWDDLDREVLAGPVVLVVGSEGAGLSRLVAQTCDLLASIPMTAATESLNASVAAGIALHEVARARRTDAAPHRD